MKNNVWIPWLYIASILGVIFVSETAVMISLPFFVPDSTSPIVKAFADAAMLTVLSAPILWLLLIKPLQTTASDAAMRYSAVVSQSRDGILTLSASGGIETANAASLKLLGQESADLVGRALVDAIPELAQWKLPNSLSNPLDFSTGSNILEVRRQRDVGDEVYLEISIAQLHLGTTYQLTLGVRDISDRKLAEQVVAEANRKVVDAAHQAGKAEIATCVIHNVGNVLTNVNVLATAVSNKVRQSQLSGLYKAAGLLHHMFLPRFPGPELGNNYDVKIFTCNVRRSFRSWHCEPTFHEGHDHQESKRFGTS